MISFDLDLNLLREYIEIGSLLIILSLAICAFIIAAWSSVKCKYSNQPDARCDMAFYWLVICAFMFVFARGCYSINRDGVYNNIKLNHSTRTSK